MVITSSGPKQSIAVQTRSISYKEINIVVAPCSKMSLTNNVGFMKVDIKISQINIEGDIEH